MQDPEQGRQRGGDPRRLGAQQLRGVGVLLLRHDARARGEGLGGLAEAELVARPEDDLGAEAREVGRADGRRVRGSRARSRGSRPRRSSSATGASKPSSRRCRATVELPVEPGKGTGAERHLRRRRRAAAANRRRVALEHPEVGEQVVAEVDRLGALQVRVAGHRPVRVGLGELQQPRLQRPDELRARARSARRTNSARSVATWSFRERPVWSLPPSGPISSVSRRSTAVWMSSSASSKLELAALELAGDRVEAAAVRSSSSAVITPARASAAAWAFEARMSCGQSRRSKPIEALIRTNSGSGGSSKRGMDRLTIGLSRIVPMRFLVTGATGKVGNAVAPALAERGDDVVALVRDLARGRGRAAGRASSSPAATSPTPARSARRPRVSTGVFNCMGIFEQWLPDPAAFDRVNAEGARNVDRRGARGGRRAASSTPRPSTSSTPARGGTVSERGLAAYPKGDRLRALQATGRTARARRGGDGIEVVICNPAGVFGPGPLGRGGTRLVLPGRAPRSAARRRRRAG